VQFNSSTIYFEAFIYSLSDDCVSEELKDAIRNDIKIAEAKLDSPSFSKYSRDSFFATLDN